MDMKPAGAAALIPMAAIGGDPGREDLEQTLRAWKSAGVDRFMIYARSGLAVPYMGERWMRICRDIVEIAAGLHMKVWLYDDFNWPSGRCDGQVTQAHPQLRGWALDVNLADPRDLQVVRGRTADILNPDAVDRFLELTHERYAAELSEYFGSVIEGFFTDEPSPIHNCRLDEAGNVEAERQGHLRLPYYRDLGADYRARTGRCLADDVTAHFTGQTPEELWPAYFALIGERMRAAFVDKISHWCQQRGLISTGHFLMEGSVTGAVYANGDLPANLASLTLPAMDEIGTNVAFDSVEWVTFACLEAAARAAGRGAMAELFALGPADMPLSRMRQMIWLAAFFGVDRYLLASPDARGNHLKTAYYNPNNRVQPWFDALGLLAEDAARAARLARSAPRRGVAVRYPQSLGAGQAWAMRSSAYTPQEPPLRTLLMALSARQLPWTLTGEDDPAGDWAAVVSFSGGGLTEERAGRAFDDAQQLADWLSDAFPRPARVLSADGGLAPDVLVKTFEDGVTAVLDLRDETGPAAGRTLTLRDADGERTLRLPHRGVAVLSKGQAAQTPPSLMIPLAADGLDLTLARGGNYARCLFDGPGREWIFEARRDIGGVRILAAVHPAPAALMLDGAAVTAGEPCQWLPPGLGELYRATAPMTVTKGRHRLRLLSGPDYPYLPRAILQGPFALRGRELDALPGRVAPGDLRPQGLENYAGELTLTLTVRVPDGALALEMDTRGLYTGVSLDGRSLGWRAWEPFVWDIPPALRGRTAVLAVTQRTSVRPLFGDALAVARLENTPDCAWVSDRFFQGMGGGAGIASLRWLADDPDKFWQR